MKELTDMDSLRAFARKLGRIADGLYAKSLLKEEQQDLLKLAVFLIADTANRNDPMKYNPHKTRESRQCLV